jgi:para-aminobenzoate synthetase component 1
VHVVDPPGRPAGWRGGLVELERWEWRRGDGGDPAARLHQLLVEHGVERQAHSRSTVDEAAVVVLAGADGCAALAATACGAPSPVPAVPDLVAVAVRRGPSAVPALRRAVVPTSAWRTTWTDDEHGHAVEQVRREIARGEVYQANVVGHRRAPHRSRPTEVAAVVASLPGADYAGLLAGDGWAVGCASPEQLVRVTGDRVTTVPVKGTRPVAPGARQALLDSPKDRAEHVMIVDLERNDLARVAVTGSVAVDELYAVSQWSGLWHAASTVSATLREDVGTLDVLRALVPGGSVTGAPKLAACALLAGLEPVGRGPAMGAFGVVHHGGLDLALTIRTVAVDDDAVHLWAGGGITWGSDAAEEVAEAHAKAAPLVRRLAGTTSS